MVEWATGNYEMKSTEEISKMNKYKIRSRYRLEEFKQRYTTD